MRTRAASYVVLSSLLWVSPGPALAQNLAGAEQTRTFTTDADFALGSFSGTRAGAPDPDQLRIDTGANVPPFLWVANSSSGTVTKLDTRTGQQVARYDSVLTRNWDNSVPPVRPPRDSCNYPVATAVDARGDAYVLNRGNCSGTSASVTKYAGSLAACVDRNGNGQIDTSVDANADGTIDLSDTAEFPGQTDECILWTKTFAAAGDPARALVVDADQNVWSAGFSSSKLYRLDGQSGAVLKTIDLKTETGAASGVQALAIGPGGYLYMSDNSTLRLVRKIDPNAADGSHVVDTLTSPVPTYGLVVDGNGVAWLGADADSATGIVQADFNAHTIQQVGSGGGCSGRTHGIAVDATGDIWAACWSTNRVLRVGSNGVAKGNWFVGRAEGVAVAADGKIWTTISSTDQVVVIDPSVTSSVQFHTEGGVSFTYGDMTGYQHDRFIVRQGTWSAVHDSTVAGANWGTVSWNQEPEGATPAGTSIQAQVRAADTAEALAAQAFATVGNNQAFAGIRGRYLEVRATLRSVNFSGEPVLSDLTLTSGNHPPVALCQDQDVCAGPACTAQVSVDHGSYDPDGDAVSLAQSPEGAYAIGSRAVNLTVSDGALTDSCAASVQVRDCEPPTITCGPAVQAECTGNESATVTASGADATDACSTASVSGPAAASYPLGTTDVTYTATDAAGNTATCTTQVKVVDTQAPSISCPPATTAECVSGGASTSSLAAATASDTCSPVTVQAPGAASFPVGTTSLTWSATDTSGNTASCSTPFTVADTQPPSITLKGSAAMTLTCAAPFVEPGYTGTDTCQGDVSDRVTVSGSVDSARAGSYVLTYNATDSAGNAAAPVTRTVTVADSQGPTITLNGANPLPLECNRDTYTEPGATATDGCSGDISSSLTIEHGAIDTSTLATYPVTYHAASSSGATATAVREVRVQDTLPPVITVSSTTTPVMECSRESFMGTGVTAMDLCAGDITGRITVSGMESIVAPGTYPITFNVTDPSGNVAQSVTRDVTVRDTQGPVVTINGESTMSLECGVDTYTELGATAYDACQGDMTSSIHTYGNGANAAAVGTYSIQYGVWDASGNTSTAVRTVKVADTLPPTISLVGEAVVQHECASGNYTDPGATAFDACYGDLSSSISKSGWVNAWARGSYVLTYNVQDGTPNKATPVTRTVQVVDTQAPTLEYHDITLSPADAALHGYSLSDCVTANDTCDGYANVNSGAILSISSDEPEDAEGDVDGSTTGDIVITGTSTFQVRAERRSDGDGRVYSVLFQLKDQSGNVRTGTCHVSVPLNDTTVASNNGTSAGYTVTAPQTLAASSTP